MKEQLKTEITAPDGTKQTIVFKEKTNNENGKYIYRFFNESTNLHFLMTQINGKWKIINGMELNADEAEKLGSFIKEKINK